jgi:hypothetical protein
LQRPGVADHDRHDVAFRRHHRQFCLGKASFQCGHALLVLLPLGPALFEVTDAGECAPTSDAVKMKPLDRRGAVGDVVTARISRSLKPR